MVMDNERVVPVKSSRRQVSNSNTNILSGPPKAFYKKYGFVEDPSSTSQNFDIDKKFIETGCFLMVTKIQHLKIQTYSVLKLNVRTLDIDPTVIHQMRWNPTEDRFEGQNIHFPIHVIVIDPKRCAGISHNDFQYKKKNKENHMKYRKLCPGNREHTLSHQKLVTSKDGLPEIPKLFCGISNESGECLWVAAAILVHSIDKFAGISMMKYHNQFPNDFQWLSMYTTTHGTKHTHNASMEGGSEKGGGCWTTLLSRNSDFDLVKVRGQDGELGNLVLCQTSGNQIFCLQSERSKRLCRSLYWYLEAVQKHWIDI
eukprot:scaffold60465_cov57-Attheya_sp.AAC.2